MSARWCLHVLFISLDMKSYSSYFLKCGFNQVGASIGVGKTRARDAALNAIQSPLLDIGIERATGIVWNITGGTDLTLFEVIIHPYFFLSLSLSLIFFFLFLY